MATVGLALSAAGLAATAGIAGAATPARTTLAATLSPAVQRTAAVSRVASTATVQFNLTLALRDAKGAAAFVRQVSQPGSSSYHHYLTLAQWESRFGPTQASVNVATAWLRQQGFTVGALPKSRLELPASGTAAQVEKAFSTTLNYYKVNGNTIRLAASALSIPSSVAGSVSGATGINQYVMTPSTTTGATAPATPTASAKAGVEPPPPAGFRNPQPCSAFWGQKLDTVDAAALFAPFTAPLAYDICGYKPSQIRAGYKLTGAVNAGTNGTGQTIAIVDAYESPTLLADAQQYDRLNDASHVLASSQFSEIPPAKVANADLCGASGWYSEQSLDVESSHAMAPGADILYSGANDCFDSSLMRAVQNAITGGATIVTNSYGSPAGDLLIDAATRNAWDSTFLFGDGLGVSLLFSSGDDGDDFAATGIDAPSSPANSPYVTAVGGTALEVGAGNSRLAEFGWSTGREVLCVVATPTCGSQTTPLGPLALQVGGGGGTSYQYAEPYYQTSVVPVALALRNAGVTGVANRVMPDVSMDADAQTGMLVGFTQTFPDGVYYSQYKIGGTSLASPLFAGVIADANQAAGGQLGFVNPALYKAYRSSPTAFNDIVPPANPKTAAVARVDYVNAIDASHGYDISLRQQDYQGPETYCDTTGNCATRPVTLTTAKGFDSMTGIGSIGPNFLSVMKNF